MQKQPVLIVVGPTAVGKTKFSLRLAEKLQAEIISADSMQVYKGMDIGTAKAGREEQKRVKHHLIDVVDPDQSFNVANYVSLAEKVLADLKARNKTALLTGGTGLYIDALIDGFLFPDSEADPKLRAELAAQAKKDPLSLHNRLKEVDAKSARRIHPNDHRRLVRALEVYLRTGEPISVLQEKKAQEERPYNPLYIGLNRRRPELYARINKRVDEMIALGLIEEVQGLLQAYPEQPTALQALGYKEIAWYLQGKMSLAEAIELLKRDTRRYAKRQLSWFRRNKKIHWFNVSKISEEEILAESSRLWQAAI